MNDELRIREDWVECSLGDFTAKKGNSLNPKKYLDETFELYSIPNHSTRKPEIVKGKEIGSSKQVVDDKWVLLSRINPHLNRTWVIKSNSDLKKIASSEWVKFPKSEILHPEFIGYFLTNSKFNNYMCMNVSGVGGSLTRTNKNAIKEYPFWLPPLTEQKAIVKKLETLFSSLDSGIADLKKAQAQLKVYRQAVLKKAFEGEYSDKEYKVVAINTLCEVVRGGSPRPAKDERFYNGNIPFMKVRDISRNTGIYVDKAEHSIKEAGLKKTRFVNSNTLLLTNSGATLGIPAITTIDTTFNDGIAAFLNLNDDLRYHYYYWCSKTIYLRNLNQGAAQPNLNTRVIGQMEIPIYNDKNEHLKIVKEIETRLSVCEQVEKDIADSLEKAKALRQSILKKAFEGKLLSAEELVQCKADADYEPASVLLEKIKAEKKKK